MVLRDYANQWSERMGIAIDVRIQGERPAPLEVEEALYRVGQEALTNVARHSGAQEALLQLAWEEDRLCLTIEDNGKGFETKRAEDPARNGVRGRGLGLASMRERVEGLHGTLVLSSSPAGTIVRACVPLVGVETPVLGAPVDGHEPVEVGRDRSQNE